MQGRGRAIACVVIGMLTSPVIWPNGLLAAAVAGLITLRSGIRNGMLLCLICLAPAVVMVAMFNSLLPFLMICATVAGAQVLRRTGSWPYTLLTLTGLALVTGVALEFIAQPLLATVAGMLEQMLGNLQSQLAEQQPEATVPWPDTISTVLVAGIFAMMLMFAAAVSLIVSRSWQAGLYNPGGFREEFHRLRFARLEVLILVVLAVLFAQMGIQYMAWVWVVLMPLLLAGIALFHALAMQRQLKMHWYVIFYCLLVLWNPLKVMLVGAALADSLFDFRRRLARHTKDQDK